VHVLIAGCGRVGAQLASALDADGHAVAIIDKDRRAFRRLADGFGGQTLTGVVFDRPTLEEAGVRRAQAFIAVTSGDNSNIVAARAARQTYGVEHVVARIYDPDRAVIYERLGITTIASARWTAEAILRAVLPRGECVVGGIGPGEGDVVLLDLTLPAHVRGLDPARLNRPGHSVLVAVTRGGATMIPAAGALLQGGDVVHVAAPRPAVDAVRTSVEQLEDVHP
jgi:trk system potassium uptake protein TrkA